MDRKADIKIDKGNVLIEIEDLSGCCFEVWDIEGKQNSLVKVVMPKKAWKNLIKKWNNIK